MVNQKISSTRKLILNKCRRSNRRRTGGEAAAKTKRTWWQIAKENPYVSVPLATAGLAIIGTGISYGLNKRTANKLTGYNQIFYSLQSKGIQLQNKINYAQSNIATKNLIKEHEQLNNNILEYQQEIELFVNKHNNPSVNTYGSQLIKGFTDLLYKNSKFINNIEHELVSEAY
jgi:hypothetical protein